MTAAARGFLREAFLRARVAVSGANFACADTGSVVVVESEGNGRMCTTLPEVLVTVMGIEKVVPAFRDLEVMLQLLPRSSTGERMNPYTSIWTGVHPGDGPRAFHLVLLDNGRTRVLADEVGRDALRCIRCSACINVCPVYRQTGGHAYHTPYAGPIGAILQPQLDGEHGPAASLPFASTLCGACADVCPVRIDIPALLVHERAKVLAAKRPGAEELEPQAARPRLSLAPGVRARSATGAPAPEAGRARRLDPALPARAVARVGAQPRPARRAGADVPRVVGVSLSARDAVLEPRQAGHLRCAAGRVLGAITSSTVRRRMRDVVEAFVDRVRDYRATVVRTDDAATAAAEVLGGQGARRIGDPRDLDERLRPAGVELVVDDALVPQQLDELDGALTTCAVACAVTGTIALAGGPGQGRRALTLLPDLHVCVVRDDQIVETVPELLRRLEARRNRRTPDRARLRPVRDLRHRAPSGSRASTDRGASS